MKFTMPEDDFAGGTDPELVATGGESELSGLLNYGKVIAAAGGKVSCTVKSCIEEDFQRVDDSGRPYTAKIFVLRYTEGPFKLTLNKKNKGIMIQAFSRQCSAWDGKAIDIVADGSITYPKYGVRGGLRISIPTPKTPF